MKDKNAKYTPTTKSWPSPDPGEHHFRLEFVGGNSAKFYVVAVNPISKSVKTIWGRIGSEGQIKALSFSTTFQAISAANSIVAAKVKKGYVLVEELVNNEEKAPKTKGTKKAKDTSGVVELSDPIDNLTLSITALPASRLPKNWTKVREKLLPGETVIYESYDDTHTRQRRNSLAKNYEVVSSDNSCDPARTLGLSESKTETILALRNAAWTLTRCAYLRFLLEANSYAEITRKAAREDLLAMVKELESLPPDQKAYIDSQLAAVTANSQLIGGFSIQSAEKAIATFVEEMLAGIRESDKVGFGGVSRRRAILLSRKIHGE